MKTTSILRLTAASVAFSISAHAAEVFSVSSIAANYPTTSAANFLDGEYDTFVPRTTDSGNGSGWGGGIVYEFRRNNGDHPGRPKH